MEQVGNGHNDVGVPDVQGATRKRREWIKAAVGLLTVALLYFILNDVVHFSSRQSLTLIVLIFAVIVYAGYRETVTVNAAREASKSTWELTPYWVRVDPKWREILLDFKLIATSGDWEQVKLSTYSAVPYGFSFTVLQQSGDGQLIFRPDDRGQFVSELNISHDVPSIEFEYPPNHLRIFMEWCEDGYDLGIIVPEKWWDKVKADCPKPLEETDGELWFESRLTLAKISSAEFSWYWQPEYAVGPGSVTKGEPQYYVYKKWEETVASQRDEERLKFGWAVDTYCLAHKYFEVQHRPI